MNSVNLKFGDITKRSSPTFNDCHYIKKMFILYYCLLSMFSNYWHIIKRVFHLLILCHNISQFMVSILHFIFQWPAYFIDTSLWMQFNEFIEFDEKLWKNSNKMLMYLVWCTFFHSGPLLITFKCSQLTIITVNFYYEKISTEKNNFSKIMTTITNFCCNNRGS